MSVIDRDKVRDKIAFIRRNLYTLRELGDICPESNRLTGQSFLHPSHPNKPAASREKALTAAHVRFMRRFSC